eukprot:TRINITY_DN9225_c0_g2_i28.p1 TRINITY_DN9225_c0_g2~~TRINITY_DN9225_c0_g2_i28.p1  ORF type:complete len:486 (+),score=97.94 TRINITY_DN9225_c0_g2_i28:74-1531(+)
MWGRARKILRLGLGTTTQETRNTKHKMQIRRKTLLFGTTLVVGGFTLWELIEMVKETFEQSEAGGQMKEKVVILGSGFGSTSLLSDLNCNKFDVTVISPRSYFLFTPLLPFTTFGTVSVESVIEDIRLFGLRKRKNFHFYEAECIDVDVHNNKITCHPVQELPSLDFTLDYDQLVVSVGAKNNTLDAVGVENCQFFTSIDDTRKIRNKVIDALEVASLEDVSEGEKKKLLSFSVVGGGPHAIFTAMQLQEFLKEKVDTSFPSLKKYPQVSLINSQDHVHNYYDHLISRYYSRSSKFLKSGVSEYTSCNVVEITPDSIVLQYPSGERKVIPCTMCLWMTGKFPHPLTSLLRSKVGPEQNNKQALLVKPNLQVEGTNNIYAIGDCSTVSQHSLLNKCEQIFDDCDLNHDNVVDRDEIRKAVSQWSRQYPSINQIQKSAMEFFEEADLNHDGRLSRQEFSIFLSLVDRTTTRSVHAWVGHGDKGGKSR